MFKLSKEDNLKEVSVTITTASFLRLAFLTALSIILFFAVKKAEHAIVLIFIAFFLSIALNAPVYALAKRLPGRTKDSRAVATSLSFLLVVVVLGIFLASIVPSLVKQTDNLIKVAPHLVSEFKNQNSPIGKFIRQHHLQKEVNSLSSQLSTRLSHAGGTAFSTAKGIGDSIFSTITILVMTFMMLVEMPRWISLFKEIVPDKHHTETERMARDMYAVIRGYVNGQVLLAALAAALITPAVLLLHIGYPAGLVLVIFVCGLVPVIGHTIGAVIVTSVALFHSTSAAAIILAYYIFYIQIEAYIIQPKVQANTTNMPPLLVFMSVVVGISFGGILGGLVAIPIAGCLRIVVLEYLRSNHIIADKTFKQVTSPNTK
jgi:predicted PurR-regulated permease PerM